MSSPPPTKTEDVSISIAPKAKTEQFIEQHKTEYFKKLNGLWEKHEIDPTSSSDEIHSGDYIRNAQHRELDMHSMYVQALIDTESQDLERQQLKLNSLVTASALLAGFAITCLVELDLSVSLKCISTGTNASAAAAVGNDNMDVVILFYGVTGFVTALSMLLASVIGIVALMYRSTINQPPKTNVDSDEYKKLSDTGIEFHEDHQQRLGNILMERMNLLQNKEVQDNKERLKSLFRVALWSFFVGAIFFILNIFLLIWIKFCAVTSSWFVPLIMTFVPLIFVLILVVGLWRYGHSKVVGDLLEK